MSATVTPIETIVAILGHPVAGNPMQFAMETAASAAHVNLRVLSFDVPPDQQDAALDALAVLGVTGVVLQGDPCSPASVLHRPRGSWEDTGLVAATGRLLLTAFGRDERASAIALGDHTFDGTAVDLDAMVPKFESAASEEAGLGEGLDGVEGTEEVPPSEDSTTGEEVDSDRTPLDVSGSANDNFPPEAPNESSNVAPLNRTWPHNVVACDDWSDVMPHSDMDLVLLSGGVDHQDIPKSAMDWLSKEKPVLLSWNGNWQSESFFSIRRLADSVGCPFVSRIGWHSALLAAAIDSWTHQAVSAEVLSDAMEEYLAV